MQLREKDILYTTEKNVADIFNSYFNRITEQLEIPSWECQTLPLNSEDSLKAKFKSHPSIKVIKSHKVSTNKFDFAKVDERDVLKTILSLNSSKSVSGNIPTRVLKIVAYTCVPFLTSCFNECINSCTFPDKLKLADIIPSFKKGSLRDKANYRPISLLPVVQGF